MVTATMLGPKPPASKGPANTDQMLRLSTPCQETPKHALSSRATCKQEQGEI